MYFDYECENSHVQEEVHGMNESPKVTCKECNKPMTRLITGGTGFALKGDGWCSTGVTSVIKRKPKNEVV